MIYRNLYNNYKDNSMYRKILEIMKYFWCQKIDIFSRIPTSIYLHFSELYSIFYKFWKFESDF